MKTNDLYKQVHVFMKRDLDIQVESDRKRQALNNFVELLFMNRM